MSKPAYTREQTKRWYTVQVQKPAGRALRLLRDAARRAKKRGLPCTVTQADLTERIARGVCEVTGVPLTLMEPNSPYSPSIDRRDPLLGYTPENTRIVAAIFNYAKHNWPDDAVFEFVSILRRSPS